MKPFRPFFALIFLLAVAGLFLLVAYAAEKFPVIRDEVGVRLPLISNLVEEVCPSEAFQENSEVPDTAIAFTTDTVFVVPKDSAFQQDLTDSIQCLSKDSIVVDSTITQSVANFEYVDSLENPLSVFFEALESLKSNGGKIRVLHYGDSQIEGDRFTTDIRNTLQNQFGGFGVGVQPVVPYSYLPAGFSQWSSDGWEYSSLIDANTDVERIGFFGGVSSVGGGLWAEKVQIKRRGGIRNSKYTRLRLIYGYSENNVDLVKIVDGITVDTITLSAYWGIEEKFLSVPLSAKKVELRFVGSGTFKILGLSMESANGVFVDNIPLRGSSGLVFSGFDRLLFRRITEWLNVKLVIVQFGVNLVPGNLKSYKYYEKQLYRQLVALKAVQPKMSIVVIGVSDMSERINGNYVSYPSVEKVRDAQRNAALRAGVAFWDTYKVMGGKNSMPQWVFAKPSLATKDFVHFNFRGAKKVAKMFTDALMLEYSNFKQQKIIKTDTVKVDSVDSTIYSGEHE